MGKKRKQREEPEEDSGEEFSVEVITKARVVTNPDTGSLDWEYYVQWAGYDREDDTWEPAQNIDETCKRLVASFWNHVGQDNEDYQEGHVEEADPSWIAEERRYFADELRADAERRKKKNEKKKSDVKGKQKEKERSSKKAKTKTINSVSSQKVVYNSGSRKRKRILSPSESEAETEDEIPLSDAQRKRQKTEPTVKLKEITLKSKGKAKADLAPEDSLASLFDGPTPPSSPQKSSESKEASPSKGKGKASFATADDVASLFDDRIPLSTPLVSSEPKGAVPPSGKELHPAEKSDISQSSPSIVSQHPKSLPADEVVQLKEKQRPSISIPSSSLAGPSSARVTSQKSIKSASAATPTSASSVRKTQKESTSAMSTPVVPSPTISATGSRSKPPPRVKEYQSPNLTTTGTATKQRIGAGAGTLVAAKSTSKHARLSFKKTSSLQQDGNVSSPVEPSPSSSTGMVNKAGGFGETQQSGTVPSRRPLPKPTQPPPRPDPSELFNDEADNIISSIAAEQQDSPVSPGWTSGVPAKFQVSRGLSAAKLARFTKMFKWTGKVEMELSGGEIEELCEVVVTECTQISGTTVQFQHVLKEQQKVLEFLSLHDERDLDAFLVACKPNQQMAKMMPAEASDKAAFSDFVTYLRRKEKVVLVPMRLDGKIVGHILVFPSGPSKLAERVQVPSYLNNNPDCLICSLLPWNLSLSEQDKEDRLASYHLLPAKVEYKQFLSDEIRWSRSIRCHPGYQLALRVLKFPDDLHEYLTPKDENSKRNYGCYFKDADGSRSNPGLHTCMLSKIMERCRAPRISLSHEGPVRAVFIHVGAMKNLADLPHFVKRRRDHHWTSFYTYGSHESVPRNRWGVKPIFPFGGVVTFTARAFLLESYAIYNLCKQIIRHPFWDCYILPEILGLVTKLVTPTGIDPVTNLENGNFPFSWFLDYIEDGKINLLRAPSHSQNPVDRSRAQGFYDGSYSDPRHEWAMSQLNIIEKDRSQLLQWVIEECDKKYPRGHESNETVWLDLEKDLMSMQAHPAVNSSRRRFVVFKGSDENVAPEKGGFEWMVPGDFNFQDDFNEKTLVKKA